MRADLLIIVFFCDNIYLNNVFFRRKTMKKSLKTLLSVILCASLLCSFFAFGTVAEEKISSCGDDCGFFPTIIVPGLGQSSVVVTDDSGKPITDKNGEKVTAFPAYLQTDKLVKKILGPALLSLFMQRDMGLSDAFGDAIYDAFGINACDDDAQVVTNVMTEKFPYPYSEYGEYEKTVVNHHVPFELYPTELPRDHLYYFEYNSFGNHIGLANELFDFIQLVREQTGHDKVNLVPLSQGASIVSAMIDYHPEVASQLHKIMFVVPALDGSKIIGDVFNDRITFLNKDYLYNGFLKDIRLMDSTAAGLVELALRLLPDEVVMETLEKGVKRLVEDVMIRSTGMWALCPSEDYPSAAERYLSSPEMASIREQTDRYYQVQKRAKSNIRSLVESGVQVFDVVEYDFPIIDVGESWNKQNGDFIIQAEGTSIGATFANTGETLPEGYVQAGTNCSNPEHNHISPDNMIDATTGLLPDTTFFFKNQRHDLTQHNDVILKLAMQLIANDDIKDVYSSPDFPQFNFGRNVQKLHELIETAEGVNTKLLTKKQRNELNSALDGAKEVLSKTVDEQGAVEKAEKRLSDALVHCGKKLPEASFPDIFSPISAWLFGKYGSNGYSEMPKINTRNFVSFLKGLFGAD